MDKDSALIQRKCPNCLKSSYKVLVDIDPKDFIFLNKSYKLEEIKKSGILELEHIPIVKCSKCDQKYVLYKLNDYLLKNVYVDFIDEAISKNKILFNKRRGIYLQIWQNLFAYLVDSTNEDPLRVKVLDYGCGWGDFLSISTMVGVESYGIEYDDRKIEYCSSKGFTVYTDIRNVKDRINILFSNQVFEHIDRPFEELVEIKNKLSKEFVGYIGVPNYNDERFDNTIKHIKEKDPVDKDINVWEHLNLFSPESLWMLMDKAGFEIFDIISGKKILKKDIKSTTCYFRLKH